MEFQLCEQLAIQARFKLKDSDSRSRFQRARLELNAAVLCNKILTIERRTYQECRTSNCLCRIVSDFSLQYARKSRKRTRPIRLHSFVSVPTTFWDLFRLVLMNFTLLEVRARGARSLAISASLYNNIYWGFAGP